MPNRTKIHKANQIRAENRWKRAREKSVIDENNNDLEMINNEVELNDDVLSESYFLIDTSVQTDLEKSDKNIQTEVLMTNKHIQTFEIVKNDTNYSSHQTKQEINPEPISNVFDILI